MAHSSTKLHARPHTNNVINYPFIDYIIKTYIPELQADPNKPKYVSMDLFQEAMMHETTKVKDTDKTYERLEYLGDAIFHMVITDYFYRRYAEENAGFLTRLRIRIERGDSMAELAADLHLEPFIKTRGIELNEHILEDVFEAFIGAFYLNFGIMYTRLFIIKLIEKHKNLAELIHYDDNYKDLLLRYFHQMKWGHPIYQNRKAYDRVTGAKQCTSIVKDPFGKHIGKGAAETKSKAEQDASRAALERFEVIVEGEIDPNWLEQFEVEVDEGAPKKEKVKGDKQPLSVFNSKNTLITRSRIKEILSDYNVTVRADTPFDLRLFYEALTHRSYIRRKRLTDHDREASVGAVKLQRASNERLQLLGDSIIHFVIGELLFHKYTDADEGFLTRLRVKLENRDSLLHLALTTGISEYILISQFIEVLHGRTNVNVNARGFEAFVGALYIELGLGTARHFVTEIIRLELDITQIAEAETNYKDLILQYYNKHHLGKPVYQVLKEEGPDHRKVFTMGIVLKGKMMGRGTAHSKKKAEQIASKQMYQKLTQTA